MAILGLKTAKKGAAAHKAERGQLIYRQGLLEMLLHIPYSRKECTQTGIVLHQCLSGDNPVENGLEQLLSPQD